MLITFITITVNRLRTSDNVHVECTVQYNQTQNNNQSIQGGVLEEGSRPHAPRRLATAGLVVLERLQVGAELVARGTVVA